MIEKVTLKKSHKSYKAQYRDGLDQLTYLRVVTGYMLFLVRKACEGWQVELAGGKSLGTLAVVFKKRPIRTDENGRVKSQKNMINWGETNKMHKNNPDAKGYVYFTNDHTHGHRASVVWWKTGMNIGNKYLYSFSSSMKLRKLITESIKNGAEYICAEPYQLHIELEDDLKSKKRNHVR